MSSESLQLNTEISKKQIRILNQNKSVTRPDKSETKPRLHNVLTPLCLDPRGVFGKRRRRQPVAGNASARHHPVALLWHLPVLGRTPPAHPAPPVPAPQTLPHGRH